MKLQSLLPVTCSFWLLTFAAPRSAAAFAPPQLVVDDDKVECPNATFTRIQDAVDAAPPGSQVRVCKGTYVEQVSISKPLDLEADSGAVLMPASMQANASSLSSGRAIAAALLVFNTANVTIRGLTLDGANNGISQCAPDLMGIFFQNASGEIDRVAVRNFRLSASLNGCQSGTGIFVQSGNGGASQVEIHRSTIHDFQKNGITANEIGTSASIDGNVVTGLGPTTGAAQNGIQIGFGAGGSIQNNTVTNNVWAPCTEVATCTAVATNILVTQSDGVIVKDNVAGISQVGIFLNANQGQVLENRTFATAVFDGIHIEGDQAQVKRNDVFNGAQSGIFIDGNNNTVDHNTITEASIGILKMAGSTGNVIQMNDVFDAPVAIQDPSLPRLSTLVVPLR
jgi:nitrous oxidase accessory protein NosD